MKYSTLAKTKSVHDNIIANYRFAFKTEHGHECNLADKEIERIINENPGETSAEADAFVLAAMKEAERKPKPVHTTYLTGRVRFLVKSKADLTADELATLVIDQVSDEAFDVDISRGITATIFDLDLEEDKENIVTKKEELVLA